jgi:hypothetical protein
MLIDETLTMSYAETAVTAGVIDGANPGSSVSSVLHELAASRAHRATTGRIAGKMSRISTTSVFRIFQMCSPAVGRQPTVGLRGKDRVHLGVAK